MRIVLKTGVGELRDEKVSNKAFLSIATRIVVILFSIINDQYSHLIICYAVCVIIFYDTV